MAPVNRKPEKGKEYSCNSCCDFFLGEKMNTTTRCRKCHQKYQKEWRFGLRRRKQNTGPAKRKPQDNGLYKCPVCGFGEFTADCMTANCAYCKECFRKYMNEWRKEKKKDPSYANAQKQYFKDRYSKTKDWKKKIGWIDQRDINRRNPIINNSTIRKGEYTNGR